MSKVTLMVNQSTGYICVLCITDDDRLIEVDVPLDLAIEIEEALAKGRKELEN